MRKINSLQLMRGIAAILVLFFHVTFLFLTLNYNFFYGIFKQGDAGVDLFFVLSGFVIYYMHNKDIGISEKGREFFTKRFIRVYPIYWLILIFLVPIYFLVPLFGIEEIRNSGNLIKSILLIPQNIEYMPLGVAWTLSHEILFYLMFGLLIILKKRFSFPIVTTWISVTIILFILTSSFGFSVNYLFGFIFSPFNIEFLGGAIVAHLFLKNKLKYGLGFIALGILGFVISQFIQVDRVILYGIPSILLIYGMVSYEATKKIKFPILFTFLGDASYSIYLTHYPLLSAINKVFLKIHFYNTVGYFIATSLIVICTVAVGCLCHLLLEKPLIKTVKRFKIAYSYHRLFRSLYRKKDGYQSSKFEYHHHKMKQYKG